jgi:hypothetical protein
MQTCDPHGRRPQFVLGDSMFKRLVAAAVLVTAAALPSVLYAQGGTMRIRYSLWSSEIGTELEVSSGTTFGTEFTLNDLGMDKKDSIEVWELEMWEGSLRMDISYWENRWDGAAQIGRQIVFEGITYNLGDVVDASFRMRTTDVSLNANLASSFKTSFAGVFGFKYIEYYAKMWDVTTAVETKEQAVAPIPYLGVSAEFMLGETTVVGGRFVMSQYSYSGTEVHVNNYYQIDAYVEFRAGTSQGGTWSPQSGLALRIGLHNIHIDYENRTAGDACRVIQIMRGTYAAIYISF